jgi:hypothetical protein
MLDELVPQREAAKKAGDGVAANALKILMNSFYGVLGTPASAAQNGSPEPRRNARSAAATAAARLRRPRRWF